MKMSWRVSAALVVGVASVGAMAQMPSPSIDRADQPFSYFSKPTDQIGVAGVDSATEITPEGFLYTGFGELMFFVGPDWQPLTPDDGPRTRTLEDGYLPIQSYDVERGGLTYHFTMFAAALGDKPGGAVVDFVRVTVSNKGKEARAGFLSTGVRYTSPQTTDSSIPDDRYRRPANRKVHGDYYQPGVAFSKDWVYAFDGSTFTRDGHVMYAFPEVPKPTLGMTLYRRSNQRPTTKAGKLSVQVTTPVGFASYAFAIAPGTTKTLDFKMPMIPMAKGDADVAAMEAASFDQYHEQVRKNWKEVVSRGMQIEVPEAKANDVFRTSLVNDVMALNHVGDDWIQTVNQLHYHGFYLRDSSDFVHMYDVTGYPDIAAKVLAFFVTKQQPDGNFLSQRGEYDGWGQTLWIYGFHERFTHDKAFAEHVYPQVTHALDWFEKATADDPLHLMPSTDVRDNEYIPGHLTGYNFLALDGLQGAATIARASGNESAVPRIEKDYATLRGNFMPILEKRAAANGGKIPPALDGDNSGADWGNLLGATPEPQLDPHNAMITATLKETQSRYQEGLILYDRPGEGKFLHDYLTIKNTLTEVERGDQEQATKELYALMLHTSSTQSGFEYSIRPWGDRDFEGNLSPHGWYAAEYRNLMRSMMVREVADKDLHLLSVVSPEWVGAGKVVKVERAPTMFGEIGFALDSTATGATLHLTTKWTQAPEHLFVHVPWFVSVKSVRVDGKNAAVKDGAVEVPADAKDVVFAWTKQAGAPAMSFAKSVDAYKQEYAKHYAEYLRTGVPFAQ
ncbi:MAG: hypothetical protein ABI142_05410 [Bryocella sp.]